jgi:hypothetical protein
MKSKVKEYILSVQKANKDAKILLVVKKSESTLVDSSDVATLLLEIREVTIPLPPITFFILAKTNKLAKDQQVACCHPNLL